jgi:hypothetical protein
MDNHMLSKVIKNLCKSLSFLVQWENENEQRRTSAKRSGDIHRANENDDVAARIINLSKVIMEYLDKYGSTLSPKELDHIVQQCLVDVYGMPSVVNGFKNDILAFYEWWSRIKRNCEDNSSAFCQVGAPFQETENSPSGRQNGHRMVKASRRYLTRRDRNGIRLRESYRALRKRQLRQCSTVVIDGDEQQQRQPRRPSE